MREGSRRSISICGDEFWVGSGLPLGWSNAQNQRHCHNKNNWAVASRRFLHSERSPSGLLFRQPQLWAAYLFFGRGRRAFRAAIVLLPRHAHCKVRKPESVILVISSLIKFEIG